MWAFILAVIAGLLVGPAEEPLAKPVARLIAPVVRIDPAEMRLLSFALLMLIVGVLAELLHSGSTFWVILGGVIGLFAMRIYAFVKARIDNRGGL
jgi:hypothetical protein